MLFASTRAELNSVNKSRWPITPHLHKTLKRVVRITAVACGITSKGPWRSSKTPGIQQALSNEYLKKAGLYSLRDGWIAVHYPNQKVS